jgi:hypothetical protein
MGQAFRQFDRQLQLSEQVSMDDVFRQFLP